MFWPGARFIQASSKSMMIESPPVTAAGFRSNDLDEVLDLLTRR